MLRTIKRGYELNEILNDPNLVEVYTTNNLQEGSKVVMSIGTFCGQVTNDDWKWVEGIVKKCISATRTPPGQNEEEEYQTINF